jgi:hypothetical protein
VVRNNLATDFASADSGVTEDHNMEIEDPAALFLDAPGYDVRLLETAAAVDAGSSEDAPEVDRDEYPRPHGPAVDIGAYEWHPYVPPDTSGTDTGGTGGSDDGDGTDDGGGSSGGTGATGSDGSGTDGGEASGDKDGCGCMAGVGSRSAWWLWVLATTPAAIRRRQR